MAGTYRTLVRGRLRQLSSLTVGGTPAVPGGPDLQCARDGLRRLTISGASLAGAFVQTAARIQPRLFDGTKIRQGTKQDAPDQLWSRVTGKTEGNASLPSDAFFHQSLWSFGPSHLRTAPRLEWRQGVGIRQRTGAAAREKGVLFDLETVPAGAEWDLWLEIDSLRCRQFAEQIGRPQAADELEQLALLALWEWAQGRCWLGANAARGQGWFQLDADQTRVLRLPLTPASVSAWPSNAYATMDAAWQDLIRKTHSQEAPLEYPAEANGLLASGRYHYLVLDVRLEAGGQDPGAAAGRDVLSLEGHADPGSPGLRDGLAAPLGVDPAEYREHEYAPDVNVAHTCQAGRDLAPLIPGSGLRGALRHMVSRYWRSQPDPWQAAHDQAQAGGEKASHNTAPHTAPPKMPVADPNEREQTGQDLDPRDQVSRVFGIETQSGRILVRDACADPDKGCQLASLHHHAEDEFTAGVYGSGKFERTVVSQAGFTFQLVFEAASTDDLRDSVRLLAPALQIAELGLLPIGAAKWRGCGWLPWRFTSAALVRAGDQVPQRLAGAGRIAELLRQAWELMESRKTTL